MLIAYLVLLCEFFWEFSIFHFYRPLVDIYWHPRLNKFKVKKPLRRLKPEDIVGRFVPLMSMQLRPLVQNSYS